MPTPDQTFKIFRSLSALIEKLPLEVSEAVAYVAAGAIAQRQGETRATVAENIASAIQHSPGAHVDSKLLDRMVTRTFRGYGRYWVEGAKLPELSKVQIASRFCFAEGEEHLRGPAESGRGVIAALPHVGSWEWGGSFLDQVGLHLTAVAESLEPPALFEWFKEKREAMGISIVPLDKHSGSSIAKVLASGGIVGLLCDRDIAGGGIEVDFLGRRARLPAGPATLALRSGAALVPAACYSGLDGHHHAVILPALDTQRRGKFREDVTRVTQDLAHAIEVLIQRAPSQWHVFQPAFEAQASGEAVLSPGSKPTPHIESS
ncbi:MAG: phosphatidylinositol mannoside acyltransferase [Actinomycetes bacterium]